MRPFTIQKPIPQLGERATDDVSFLSNRRHHRTFPRRCRSSARPTAACPSHRPLRRSPSRRGDRTARHVAIDASRRHPRRWRFRRTERWRPPGSDGKATYLSERTIHKREAYTLRTGVRVTEATIRLWNVKTGEAPPPTLDPRRAGRAPPFCGRRQDIFRRLRQVPLLLGKRYRQEGLAAGGRRRRNFHDGGVHLQGIIQAGETLASLHGGTVICPVEKDGGSSFHYHPQLVVRLWNAKTGARCPWPRALQSTINAGDARADPPARCGTDARPETRRHRRQRGRSAAARPRAEGHSATTNGSIRIAAWSSSTWPLARY